MKLTAVSLSVMLLLAGMSSCVTRDKTEPYIPKEDVLSEMPVKEEKAELPPPPPPQDSIQIRLPIIINSVSEPVIIGSGVYTIGCDIIPPPVEEDSIEIKEDDYMVLLGCDLESEAEYPGGTKAWMRYLHSNVQVPKDIIDSETDSNVVVQFVVDEEGCVREAKAVRGSLALGAEVVRVINESSRWIPAKRLSTDKCIRSFKMQPFIVRFETEE